jgi:hypothetical protein
MELENFVRIRDSIEKKILKRPPFVWLCEPDQNEMSGFLKVQCIYKFWTKKYEKENALLSESARKVILKYRNFQFVSKSNSCYWES